MKMTNKFMREFNEYNKTQRRWGLKPKSLQDYIDYRAGKSRYVPKGIKSGLECTTQIRKSPDVPSGSGIGVHFSRKRENKYTGDEIMGIAVMHKSNLVPVRKQGDAEDIAKMRRN